MNMPIHALMRAAMFAINPMKAETLWDELIAAGMARGATVRNVDLVI